MDKVMVIGSDGSKLGWMTLNEAGNIARQQKLTLSLVNPDHKIYKLIDLGKVKYEQKQKQKKQRMQQKTQKIKEIRLRPTTDTGDIEIKLKKVKAFLAEGLKTKLVMKFNKSQLVYKNAGLNKMQGIAETLVKNGLAVADKPSFEGNSILMFLTPVGKSK